MPALQRAVPGNESPKATFLWILVYNTILVYYLFIYLSVYVRVCAHAVMPQCVPRLDGHFWGSVPHSTMRVLGNELRSSDCQEGPLSP